MSFSVNSAITDVREALDDVTMGGELAIYDTGLEDAYSAAFSDEEIAYRVLDGARYVAARCRANYLDELVEEVRPSREDVRFPTEGDDPPFLRLLASRVRVQDNEATRRSVMGNERLEKSGQKASDEEPAYVYEDYQFYEVGTARTAWAHAVRLPYFDSLDGEVIKDATEDNGSSILMGAHLYQPVVYYATQACLLSRGEAQLAASVKQQMLTELEPYMLPVFRTLLQQQEGDE